MTEQIKGHARTWIGRLTHFLDIPVVLIIVYLGVVRPDSWVTVGGAIGIAIAAALVLMYTVPRLAGSMAATRGTSQPPTGAGS